MLRQRRCFGAFGLLAYLLAGCGGSGGEGGTTLSGTQDVQTFVIPAGQTETVTGDLAIHASQNIEIDGNLEIPDGVNVALIADGPLIVKGKIEAVNSKGVTKSASTVERAGNHHITECGSPSSIFSIGISPKGTDINVAINAAGDLHFTSIIAGNGVNSTKAGTPGGNGGAVEIGTDKANTAALADKAKNGVTPDNVQGSLVFGGNGGTGYNDPGSVDGQSMVATGTVGGAGGNVAIQANLSVTIGTIQGGAGGKGGSGTTTPSPAVAADATPGLNSEVTTGNGGPGGSIKLGGLTDEGTAQPGPGGAPGDSTATAQSGGEDANGGNSEVTCGDQGADGTPGTPWSNGSVPGQTFLGAAAGSGGASNNQTVPGGDAGTVTVANERGNGVSIPKFTISVACGKGGAGSSGVCGVGSNEKATNGGKGGSVDTKGSPFTQTVNGDGGNGGSGNPIGIGGAGGTNLRTFAPIGSKGKDGNPCQTTGATVTSTLSVPNSNIAFLTYNYLTGCLIGFAADLGKMAIFRVVLATNGINTYNCPGSITDDTNGIANSSGVTRGRRRGNTNPIYVSSIATSTIYILDEATGTQLGTIAVPSSAGGPGALAFDSTTGRLYAGVSKGIEVYDTTNNNQLLGTIPITGIPYTMVLNPATNRLYASDQLKDFDVVDTKNMTQVATMVLPDIAYTLAVNPNNGVVFATQYNSSKVVAIDPSSNQIVQTLMVGNSPWGIEVDSQRNRLYVANYNYSQTNQQPGSLSEIDANTYQTITTVTLGKGPTGVSVDEVGDKIYVANGLDSTVSILNGN